MKQAGTGMTGPALMFPIRERSQLFTFHLLMCRTATIFYNSINKRILFYIAVSAALTSTFPYFLAGAVFPTPSCGQASKTHFWYYLHMYQLL